MCAKESGMGIASANASDERKAREEPDKDTPISRTNEGEDKGRRMGRGGGGGGGGRGWGGWGARWVGLLALTRDGGGCLYGVGTASARAARGTVLAHALVCRRRWLDSNHISTIANGAFTGLTALTHLYGTGLDLVAYCWCSDVMH
jgi:hypothetical protein